MKKQIGIMMLLGTGGIVGCGVTLEGDAGADQLQNKVDLSPNYPQKTMSCSTRNTKYELYQGFAKKGDKLYAIQFTSLGHTTETEVESPENIRSHWSSTRFFIKQMVDSKCSLTQFAKSMGAITKGNLMNYTKITGQTLLACQYTVIQDGRSESITMGDVFDGILVLNTDEGSCETINFKN